jgi:sugar-specific transcriptional regulator TrmB
LEPQNKKEIGWLLDRIGLTDSYTHNAYFALLEHPDSTASALAAEAGIPPSKAYEILGKLQHKGLVTKVDSRPSKFVLNPPKNVFSQVISEEKAELTNAQSVLSNLKFPDEVPGFNVRVLAGRRYILDTIVGELRASTVSYETFVGLSTPYPPIIEVVKQKVKQGLTVRYLADINSPEKLKSAKFYEKLGVDIRHYPIDAPIRFSLHDRKRLVFTLIDFKNEWVSVFTNADSFMKTLSDLFDHYWENSQTLSKVRIKKQA